MTDEGFYLTPLDVRRYDFGKAIRGYDPKRVDQFRDQIADPANSPTGAADHHLATGTLGAEPMDIGMTA